MKFLEEEIHFYFIRRMLRSYTTLDDKLDALATGTLRHSSARILSEDDNVPGSNRMQFQGVPVTTVDMSVHDTDEADITNELSAEASDRDGIESSTIRGRDEVEEEAGIVT